MYLAKKPTKKEIVEIYQETFNKLDNLTPIDLHFAKETEYSLKRYINNQLELVEYVLNHPCFDEEINTVHNVGIQFLNQELRQSYNSLIHNYRQLENRPIHWNKEYF